MKIGIITDAHSNIQALKAILNEIEKIGVDKIICCGDIIGIGLNPEEVVQELINLKDKLISVKGNHEQYLLRGLPKEVHDDKRKMSQEEIGNHKWNHSKLSQKSIDFLAQLKESENIKMDGKEFYIVRFIKTQDSLVALMRRDLYGQEKNNKNSIINSICFISNILMYYY